MVTHRFQWLVLSAMLASAVWTCPEVRAQGRNDKKPTADPSALTDEQKAKVQAAIDLLEAKANSLGESAELKACLDAAMAKMQEALDDDPPRVEQGKEGEGPHARKKNGRDVVVLPPAEIEAPVGEIQGRFVQLLDSLLHEGIHLKQGLPDPLPDNATGEDELERKKLNVQMEYEAYHCESLLKAQIGKTLKEMSEGSPAPPWAQPWVDANLGSGGLKLEAEWAKMIALHAAGVAGHLKAILQETIPVKEGLGMTPKAIADEIDLDEVVKAYASGKGKRRYVVGGRPLDPIHTVNFVDSDGTAGFHSLDTGIPTPQGGVLIVDFRGGTHFLLCGRDAPSGPMAPPIGGKDPHGIVKDFFDTDDDGTLDGSRTLVENQEGLLFPTSMAQLPDGRVYLFDAQTWSAYPLVDTDRDGIPDLWLASPVLTVPPGLRDRHPVDLLPAGDALVLQPRIAITLDNNAWRMVFSDPDGDGIFHRGVVDAPPPSPRKKGGGAPPPEPPGGGGRK